jgi:hypothetical protein
MSCSILSISLLILNNFNTKYSIPGIYKVQQILKCLIRYISHKNVKVVSFFIIKPTRCTNFSNLFWDETLHISDNSFVHHQEFSTVHTAVVYTYMSYRCVDSFQAGSRCSCSQAVRRPEWHMPLLYVQWKTCDDGQRNCPKHVDFHSRINLRN